MFLSDIPRALLRRWYIVLLGLILTADLGLIALRSTPPDYTVVAEALLLPPPSTIPQGGNPYLSLGGLNAVGDILSRAMTDSPAVEAMRKAGLEGEFTIARDGNSAAPLVLITTIAKSNASAIRTTDIILNQLPLTLKTLQAATLVPADSLITAVVVVHPNQATSSNKGQLRVVLVAIAAGIALTLLLTALVDRLLARGANRMRRLSLLLRRSRRAEFETDFHDDSVPQAVREPTRSALKNSSVSRPVVEASRASPPADPELEAGASTEVHRPPEISYPRRSRPALPDPTAGSKSENARHDSSETASRSRAQEEHLVGRGDRR